MASASVVHAGLAAAIRSAAIAEAAIGKLTGPPGDPEGASQRQVTQANEEHCEHEECQRVEAFGDDIDLPEQTA